MLLAVLPVMNVLAAPAPVPLGILDIGTPHPKDERAKQFVKLQIEFNTDHRFLDTVLSYPEVKKLPSVASMENPRPWLAKNIRVTPGEGDRLLSFTFLAGKRNEQVTIINAFLRANLHWHDLDGKAIQRGEQSVRTAEAGIRDLEQRIQSGQQPHMVDEYREHINRLRHTLIPELRAEIARMKQYAVLKWAR
jgi:hypothetical protein